jgi:alcohol dehydrogenase (cytochrome c)
METRSRLLTATLAATATLGLSAGANAQTEPFATTTIDRLLNADAEPHNWLLADGNYSNWHYSQLDEINRDNVGNLRLLYMASTRGCMQQAPSGTACNEHSWPRVENGILYLTDNINRVMAFDVTSGDQAVPLWRFDPATDPSNVARGIALYSDWVIQTTADRRIIAIDKQSGEQVWEAGIQEVVDQPNTQEMLDARAFAGTPQVYPTSSGQPILIPGIRGPGVGWVGAYNADNGELMWRTHTIPLPGDPNFGTWPDETWRSGAVMVWGAPPAYDPATNTLYIGTGEPSPSTDPEFRPGDNLYSVSTLALNADTGAINWYFQDVPNDQWDFDSTSTRILFDVPDPTTGQPVKAVSYWARNRFFYSLNRETGEFLRAVQQLESMNWTAGLDPKTGKPVEYDPNAGLQTYAVAGPRRGRLAADAPRFCATWSGGATGIWPASYDPTTGITYQTMIDGCAYSTIVRSTDEAFNPLAREGLGSSVQTTIVDTRTALISIDTASGEVLHRVFRDINGVPDDNRLESGVLATAGGVIFTAANDGRISAFNSDTLEELWHYNVGTKNKGATISFAVDGKQYIARIAGGDDPASGSLVQPSAMLVVFGL